MGSRKVVLAGLVGAGSLLFILSTAKGHRGGQAPDAGSISDSDLETVTISLERTLCYGICPAYSIVVHGDGQIEYVGKSHVKEIGAHEGRIDVDKVRNLMSQFAKAKFETIADDYSQQNCKGRFCTDMPTAITEFVVKGKSHKVTHYYGCGSAPKVLFELESSVDKVANAERWTGDVSHAGPYGRTCNGGD
jgi:hypothetical protein